MQTRTPEVLPPLTLADVLAGVEGQSEVPIYRFSTFGKKAKPREIAELFSRLMHETKPAKLSRLLAVFRDRRIPPLEPGLLKLVFAANDEVRSWAVLALRNVRHNKIRRLGLELLAMTTWPQKREASIC